MPLPPGVCIPPMCWQLTYNFANIVVFLIKPADAAAGNWNKKQLMPVNMFQNQVNAAQAALNAQANVACDKDCVCVRLHPNAVNFTTRVRIGAGPGGLLDVYMDNIAVTGFFGLCARKKWVRVKKGGKWIPVEDLGPADILTPLPSSGGSGGGNKKKGKKGKKKRRLKKR